MDAFTSIRSLEAYERLLHDAMIGDHALFNGTAGVQRLCEISVPLLKEAPARVPYACGSWAWDRSLSPHPIHPPPAPESALRSGHFKTR